VWSVRAGDPPGSSRLENWVLPNMGSSTPDVPWSIAWDNDSNCYWISSIVDGSFSKGCNYTRIRRTAHGDTWRWFSENPEDTWQVGDSAASGVGRMYWMAGSEKWLNRDYFACAPVAPTPSTDNYVWKFDPYTKTGIGRCAHGDTVSERGCALVPWDSNYIITTGWNANTHYLRDSNGAVLRSAAATQHSSSDLALWVPQNIGPDDTVFMYCTCGVGNDIIQKISVGLLWGQLEPGQAIGEPGRPVLNADDRLHIEPNPCRAFVRISSLLSSPSSLSLSDISGRKVLDLRPGANDVRALAPGVYFVRSEPSAASREPSAVTKVVVTR
jgi:hypothetical protein